MQQLDKRLQNKWWRLTHLYKIKNKQGEVVTFKPNDVQLRHLAERGAHRYNRILKYRQGGITTLYAIDELDEALWIPGMTCGIIAHEAKKLPDYFNIVKRAYTNLPPQLMPTTKTDTKHMYEFLKRFDGAPLDSSIYVSVDIRGGTVQRLHITEVAYIKDLQKLKAGTKQAVPLTGSISEETTGNGFNEWYDDFESARNNPTIGDMDYKTYFYSWVQHPEYTLPGTIEVYTPTELKIKQIAKEQLNIEVTDGQLLWRRWKMRELTSSQEDGVKLNTEQLFRQEYPLTIAEAFQSGAGNVFDTEKIENTLLPPPITLEDGIAQLQAMYPGDPTKVTKFEALMQLGVRIWELPQPGKLYVIGVDPSDGVGSDFGPVDVWDDEQIAQVAQYYGNVRPDELAEVTAELGYFYNEAYAGVENNMLSCILFLSKIYTRYHMKTEIDKKTLKKTKIIGWNTNTKTRDPMIDDFRKMHDEDALIIRSPITLREMKTFVKKENGKREHANGKHDDALIAAMIAIQMRKYNKNLSRAFSLKPF